MQLSSPAFDSGCAIPKRHSADGVDRSPPLAVADVPDGADWLALICADPDAPTPRAWVHWVLYGLPASLRRIPASLPRGPMPSILTGARQGLNDWQITGWRGPDPPVGHGVHRYHFHLFAVFGIAPPDAGLTAEELEAAIADHLVARALLVGTYERR